MTFIAHSFGTLLAAYYEERYPEEVEHLFLLGTPVFADEREARAHIREMSSMSGLFTLNPILAREACKLHEAAPRRLLARIVPRFLTDVPEEVSREALLHTWQSFNGSLRNIVLAKQISLPLDRIGPKVTFVHGQRIASRQSNGSENWPRRQAPGFWSPRTITCLILRGAPAKSWRPWSRPLGSKGNIYRGSGVGGWCEED